MRRAMRHEDYEDGIYSENYPFVSSGEPEEPWTLTLPAFLMAGAAGLLLGYWITFHAIPWLVERGVG